MNILFIKEKRALHGLDGTANNVLRRCVELKRRNISHSIIYNSKDEFYEKCLEKGLDIIFYPFSPNSPRTFLFPWSTRKDKHFIRNIIASKGITHVHTHNPYLLNLVPQIHNVPVTCHQHSAFNDNSREKFNLRLFFSNPRHLITFLHRKFFSFNFKKAKLVLNVSTSAQETTIKKYRVPKEKNIVLWNGIEKLNQSKTNNVLHPIKRIISIGRITPAKGPHTFGEVAKLLKQSHPEIEFIYLGEANDLDYKDEILSQYKNYVDFKGHCTNILDYLQSSSLMILFSEREACPNAVIESFFFGIPVIGWNVVGMNDVIKDGVNGFLPSHGNIDHAIEHIKQLIEDKNLYEKLSNNAFESAKYYTIEKNVDDFLNILERL